ncbi:MAG: hypothetical protein V3R99_09385, partial [Thermoguttaceae bacterium]
MKRRLFALTVMILAVAGCQDRRFIRSHSTPSGIESGIPTESVKGFAKDRGISEKEAIEYFRNGQTFPQNSQQIATDPPIGGSATRTGTAALDSDADPLGEATASDASPGSLEPPQSDLGSSMI